MSLLRTAALLLALLAPVAAPAQAPPSAAAGAVPRCIDQGVSRMAVVKRAGQTPEMLRAALGAVLPGGAELHFMEEVNRPALRDMAEVRERVGAVIGEFGEKGWKLNGEAITLLHIDEDGRVKQSTVQAGHDSINAALGELWRKARFAPTAVRGCRVPVWMQAPLRFVTVDKQLRVEYQRPQ